MSLKVSDSFFKKLQHWLKNIKEMWDRRNLGDLKELSYLGHTIIMITIIIIIIKTKNSTGENLHLSTFRDSSRQQIRQCVSKLSLQEGATHPYSSLPPPLQHQTESLLPS